MHLYIFWFGNINIVLKKIKLGEINKKIILEKAKSAAQIRRPKDRAHRMRQPLFPTSTSRVRSKWAHPMSPLYNITNKNRKRSLKSLLLGTLNYYFLNYELSTLIY